MASQHCLEASMPHSSLELNLLPSPMQCRSGLMPVTAKVAGRHCNRAAVPVLLPSHIEKHTAIIFRASSGGFAVPLHQLPAPRPLPLQKKSQYLQHVQALSVPPSHAQPCIDAACLFTTSATNCASLSLIYRFQVKHLECRPAPGYPGSLVGHCPSLSPCTRLP